MRVPLLAIAAVVALAFHVAPAIAQSEASSLAALPAPGSAAVLPARGGAPVALLDVRHGNGRGAQSPFEFFFTRGIYSGASGNEDWGARWAVDYPKAELQFLVALRRLSVVDAYDSENAMALDDPELRNFPFLYILEVGYMSLGEAEAEGLRNYLLAGGFLVIDDFWGTWAWQNFEHEISRVLPGREIVDVPPSHPIFHVFYDIGEILQVPNVYQGSLVAAGGPTHEYDGYVPHVRGIFDDDGRLMVLINWNTDLGDAWEWADDPNYPLKFSTFAFEMGINFVVYAMSH